MKHEEVLDAPLFYLYKVVQEQEIKTEKDRAFLITQLSTIVTASGATLNKGDELNFEFFFGREPNFDRFV